MAQLNSNALNRKIRDSPPRVNVFHNELHDVASRDWGVQGCPRNHPALPHRHRVRVVVE